MLFSQKGVAGMNLGQENLEMKSGVTNNYGHSCGLGHCAMFVVFCEAIETSDLWLYEVYRSLGDSS